MTVELIVDSQSELAEGPSWDEKDNKLYWVDIVGKKFYRYDPLTGINTAVQSDQLVGAIAPRNNGGVILALQNGFYFYDYEHQQYEKIHNPESHIEHNRFNDGKCDPAGRFWAGTMDGKGANGKGSLYVLHKDLKVEKKLENVTISNGMAWSPDYSKMYYIDTPTQQVVSFDYSLQTGHIDNPQVVITFPEGAGSPDGMTIDQDGMLWIAHWSGYGISRYNPTSGKQIEFISIPSANVTSCSFGGENLDQLYVTTARIGTSQEDLEKYPHAGGLFRLKMNIKGSKTFQFNG
ncbi:sugar lactone lactonase YvrE [Bacillus mesophilus]|uniref:SMP-30/gluconolactonase/LRE family protein n=1 Tax=Bacillus mesophilus TaxID=1808955 RepID=A0A6M0QA49_9BACI|nr:SMP-30/gluconolactonase/LRE family protein [Bacillus mesophilus]MBM7662697.1 sugar lactone lactonase YvrE [Bacillus mesophilus]NEY73241.1 SMP-30/gluconolactonase/LRE family protein [Bacillus mesophilus]